MISNLSVTLPGVPHRNAFVLLNSSMPFFKQDRSSTDIHSLQSLTCHPPKKNSSARRSATAPKESHGQGLQGRGDGTEDSGQHGRLTPEVHQDEGVQPVVPVHSFKFLNLCLYSICWLWFQVPTTTYCLFGLSGATTISQNHTSKVI